MERLWSSARSSTHYGSIGKRDFQELAAIRSVPKRMDGQRNGHAWRDRLRPEALAHQAVGPAHLNRPPLRLTFLVDGQNDPGMRVRPLELLDGALQGELPVRIELGKGMMRESGNRVDGRNDTGKTERPEFHQAHLHRSHSLTFFPKEAIHRHNVIGR
jgi:hypothetical protein